MARQHDFERLGSILDRVAPGRPLPPLRLADEALPEISLARRAQMLDLEAALAVAADLAAALYPADPHWRPFRDALFHAARAVALVREEMTT